METTLARKYDKLTKILGEKVKGFDALSPSAKDVWILEVLNDFEQSDPGSDYEISSRYTNSGKPEMINRAEALLKVENLVCHDHCYSAWCVECGYDLIEDHWDFETEDGEETAWGWDRSHYNHDHSCLYWGNDAVLAVDEPAEGEPELADWEKELLGVEK